MAAAGTDHLEYVRIAREEAIERARSRRDRRRSWQQGVFATGRVFLGLVFVGSAASMLSEWSVTVASLTETVVDVRRLLPFAVGFQLAAGAAIVLGLAARPFAVATALYLVAGLLVAPPDLELDLGRSVALAHLGLAGALAMVAAHGAGKLSADHVLRRRRIRRRACAKAAAEEPPQRRELPPAAPQPLPELSKTTRPPLSS